MLYTLQRRIDDATILDPDEVNRGVEAILAGGTKGSKGLNAATDPAVERFRDLDDEEAELFRTALRDFVRTYAFLAQIMPFTDPDMERLYYYGKYLLTRLPTVNQGGAVDLDESVVLTHLRTELISDQSDISPDEGSDEPLISGGTGEGRQVSTPEERLSELIAALNERFGLDLTDADRILFEQQTEVMVADPDVLDAARGNNDFDQFRVFAGPLMDALFVDRHAANGDLFKAYFDNPEFRSMIHAAVLPAVYATARDDVG